MSQTAWIVLTAVTVACLLGMGFSLRKELMRLRGDDKSWMPPQLRFGYRPEDVAQDLERLGAPGRKVLRRFDCQFFFMLVFVGLALAVVAHNAAELRWMRMTMYAMTALGCFSGAMETLLLLGEMRGAKAASVCGYVKWGCFAVWVLGMFAGLFLKGWAL